MSRYEIPSGFIVKRVAQAWEAPSTRAKDQKKIRSRRGLKRCGLSSRDTSVTDIWGGDEAFIVRASCSVLRDEYR